MYEFEKIDKKNKNKKTIQISTKSKFTSLKNFWQKNKQVINVIKSQYTQILNRKKKKKFRRHLVIFFYVPPYQ